MTVHISGQNSGINTLFINFNQYYNFYSIEGANKVLISSLEANIIDFGKTNRNFWEFNHFKTVLYILSLIIFIYICWKINQSHKSISKGLAIGIILNIMINICLFFWDKIFHNFLIYYGEEVGFFESHIGFIAFLGLIISIISIFKEEITRAFTSKNKQKD